MNHADFIHLVRVSEQDCEADGPGYRRRLAWFTALGYGWVMGCALLGLLAIAGVVWWWAHDKLRVAMLFPLMLALGLLGASLQALWLRMATPTGIAVTRADAPTLFEALDKLRKAFKGPEFHHVLLIDDFNAGVTQIPRFGLFGEPVNYLSLGLPLLLAVDRTRLMAILAHEYAHLREEHGIQGAWIYRTRITWLKLYHQMRHDDGLVTWLTQGFFQWFFPRFAARSFALARQDEYDADRLAAQLVGAPVMAAALIETQVKTVWLEKEFWPTHWRQTRSRAEPVSPFADMLRLLPGPLQETFAKDALREAMKRLSGVADTHPVLRDRLSALQQATRLPDWSTKPAATLLGPKLKAWVKQLEAQWCRDHASDWKLRHAYLQRLQKRVDLLLEAKGRNNADEMVELAQLQLRLDPKADVRAHYERALAITAGHGAALRGLVQCLGPEDHGKAMLYLDELFDYSVANRWWASQHAVSLLDARMVEHPQERDALILWRDRLQKAEEAERRAQLEHLNSPILNAIARQDLSEFELGEFRSQLAQVQAVARAWLVNKNLKEFPQRRCYTLILDLPQLDEETRVDICSQLQDRLSLPGNVWVLWVDRAPSLRDIERAGLHPTYVRAAR